MQTAILAIKILFNMVGFLISRYQQGQYRLPVTLHFHDEYDFFYLYINFRNGQYTKNVFDKYHSYDLNGVSSRRVHQKVDLIVTANRLTGAATLIAGGKTCASGDLQPSGE